MGTIELENFYLKEYDWHNQEDLIKARLFESDKDFCNYIGEFSSFEDNIRCNQAKDRYCGIYLAYKDTELIGMVGLIWILDLPEIIVSILPDFRGNHYSSKLSTDYVTYIFETYKEYTKLYATINPENTHSIENILLSGFEKFNDLNYIKRRK